MCLSACVILLGTTNEGTIISWIRFICTRSLYLCRSILLLIVFYHNNKIRIVSQNVPLVLTAMLTLFAARYDWATALKFVRTYHNLFLNHHFLDVTNAMSYRLTLNLLLQVCTPFVIYSHAHDITLSRSARNVATTSRYVGIARMWHFFVISFC